MKKILVIEDELSLRKGVSEILFFENFEVLEAENGLVGVQLAEQHLPDLILCDIMMPGMDGHEVLMELSKSENSKLIPFIFMTALSERSDQRTGMELGADDYITKPFTRDELLSAVNTRIKKSDDIKEKSDATLNELRLNIISALPHELRTPLNGMLGYGEILMETPEVFSAEELPKLGRDIYDSAMRLYRLIQNYLLYAQLELNKFDKKPPTVLIYPEKVCTETATKWAKDYNRSDDLELNAEGGVVLAYADEFGKIVEELTDNAFKFSEKGTKVIVSCRQEKENYLLTVEDHGSGIAATDITKIGAYMQFDRKLYEQQGSGLGLIITMRLVEMFGGKIKIDSKKGEGTTVNVWLPGK